MSGTTAGVVEPAHRGSGSRGFSRSLLAAAAAGLVFVGVFATWILLNVGGSRASLIFDDVATFVAALVASMVCLWAAVKNEPGSRREWAWLSAYTFLWAVGEGTWGFYELILHHDVPFPSLADIGYLGAVPFGLVAILMFRGAPSGRAARARTVLDGGIIAGALLFVSWAFVLGPTFHSSSGTLLEQILSLAYPLSDVLIGAMALAVLARSEPGSRAPLVLVVLGLLAMTIGDGVYAYLTQIDAYGTTNIIDAVWIAGYVFFALAAVCSRSTESRPRPVASGIPMTRVLVPYCALSVAGLAAVTVQLNRGSLGPFLFFTGFGVVGLSAVRQLLLFLENRQLNSVLGETVDSLRRREDELEHLAFHDPLTQLANRALFRDRVEHAIALGAREGRQAAVLFIDLDDFKSVNDTLGHGVGDDLLISFSERLRACVRPGDTVARLGGDEFGILLDGAGGMEQRINAVAERILASTRVNFSVAGHELRVTASIGITTGVASIEDASGMLRSADIALYEAKANGKSRYEIYEPAMASTAIERLELRAALQQAIDEDQFRVAYQPIVALDTETVVGYEALVRWHHPIHGVLEPATFLSIAEETGLIIPIGRSVLDQACAQARLWNQRGGLPEGFAVHVNLSARELLHQTVIADVADILRTTGVDPAGIVLEVTESAVIGDTDLALAHLRSLKSLGFQIGLDDFGTGYSSLSYLRMFPIDVLKIDRSFVTPIGADEDSGGSEQVLGAIIQLGHALGIRTIAEGVENPVQAALLSHLHCDAAQGYWFGRPQPAEYEWVPAFATGRQPAP